MLVIEPMNIDRTIIPWNHSGVSKGRSEVPAGGRGEGGSSV